MSAAIGGGLATEVSPPIAALMVGLGRLSYMLWN
jgi:hypothetical protein